MNALNRNEIAKLSDASAADLLIELRRRGLKLDDQSVTKGRAECPKCGHKGPIEKDFGVRIMRGQAWPQSWCKECRAKGTTTSKPKKNQKKHKQSRQTQTLPRF